MALPPFDLFILAFVVFPPLLYLLERKPATSPFLVFYCFSFFSYLFILHWVPQVMVKHGHTSPLLGVLGLLALAAILSLFPALAGMLIRLVLRKEILPALIIPAIWVAKDFVLENILGGFPWCSLGYSQHLNIPFIQVAEWGGIHLITFLVVSINIMVYRFLRKPTLRSFWPLGLVLLCIHGSGLVLQSASNTMEDDQPQHLAGILQPNTRNDDVFTAEKNRAILERMLTESESLHRRGARFVVWPEFSIPVYPLQNEYYHGRLQHFSRNVCPLLAGFTDYQGQDAIYNSLLLYQDAAVSKYDKVHLAPFGEYIPLKGLLFFVEKISREIGEFTPGEEIHNLELAGHSIAPPICYELIYPQLVRDFIARGGEVIVITSNDSWYHRSSAPYQLLAMTVFRSVENRRFTIRSTTSGISALISPTGKILRQSQLDEREAFIAPFAYLHRKTLYTRIGFVFPHLCLILTSLLFIGRGIMAWRRRERIKS